jgi:hypothetical protein
MFKLKYVAILSAFSLIAGMSEAMIQKIDPKQKNKKNRMTLLTNPPAPVAAEAPSTNLHDFVVNVFAPNQSEVVIRKTGFQPLPLDDGFAESYFENVMSKGGSLSQDAMDEALGLVQQRYNSSGQTGLTDDAKRQLIAVIPAILAKIEYGRIDSFVGGWQAFASSFLNLVCSKGTGVLSVEALRPTARLLLDLAVTFAELHPDDTQRLSEYMINWLSMFVAVKDGKKALSNIFGVVQHYIKLLKTATSNDAFDYKNLAKYNELTNNIKARSDLEQEAVTGLELVVSEAVLVSKQESQNIVLKQYDLVRKEYGELLYDSVGKLTGTLGRDNVFGTVNYTSTINNDTKAIMLTGYDRDAVMAPLSIFRERIQDCIVKAAYDPVFLQKLNGSLSPATILNIIGARVGLTVRDIINDAVVSPLNNSVGGFLKPDNEGRLSMQDGLIPDVIRFMVLFNTLFGENSFATNAVGQANIGIGTLPLPQIAGREYKALLGDVANDDKIKNLTNALVLANPNATKQQALAIVLRNLSNNEELRKCYEIGEGTPTGAGFGALLKTLNHVYKSIIARLWNVSKLPQNIQRSFFNDVALRSAYLANIATPNFKEAVTRDFMTGSFVHVMNHLAESAKTAPSVFDIHPTVLKLLQTSISGIDTHLVMGSGGKSLFSLASGCIQGNMALEGSSDVVGQITDGLADLDQNALVKANPKK